MVQVEASARPEPAMYSAEPPLERARKLIPLIEREAPAGEQLTHLTDDVVGALKQAGLFHMLLPAELGGAETSLREAMDVVELLAWADGSTGWYAMVGNALCASLGAYLPEEGAKQVYGDNPLAMAAGQGVPRGRARRVDGGYVINGPWSYGSAIYHADYVHSGCMIMGDGGPILDDQGTPKSVICHFKSEHIKLLGNWDTLGLRGTGSYDYDLAQKDLFVPDHMCYEFASSASVRGGRQYSIGLIGFTAWCHTSWALGVARRALDEIVKLAPAKAGPLGALGDSITFRQGLAEAEAKYRAARAFAHQSWEDLEATLVSGTKASLEQITLVRMAMRHIHDVGAEVVGFAYRAGGGTSLRPGALQRAYRDMSGGTQHGLLADQIYQECGRVMLGMVGDDAYWSGFQVLD